MMGNLASTYTKLGRLEEAVSMQREIYSGYVKLHGEQHKDALLAATHYADSLIKLERFEETKSLLRKKVPVARRVLGKNDTITLSMQLIYAEALYSDYDATFAHLREAKGWLEDAARTARRVLGGPHPTTRIIEAHLDKSVAVLRLSTTQEWRRRLTERMPEGKSFEELRLDYLTRTT